MSRRHPSTEELIVLKQHIETESNKEDTLNVLKPARPGNRPPVTVEGKKVYKLNRYPLSFKDIYNSRREWHKAKGGCHVEDCVFRTRGEQTIELPKEIMDALK